jgi:antitoxin VapB
VKKRSRQKDDDGQPEGKMITTLFRSGDSQYVLIPHELAYDDPAQELEVERKGDLLLFRPVSRKKLTGIGEVFSMFSPDFMASGREPNDD